MSPRGTGSIRLEDDRAGDDDAAVDGWKDEHDLARDVGLRREALVVALARGGDQIGGDPIWNGIVEETADGNPASHRCSPRGDLDRMQHEIGGFGNR